MTKHAKMKSQQRHYPQLISPENLPLHFEPLHARLFLHLCRKDQVCSQTKAKELSSSPRPPHNNLNTIDQLSRCM